MPCCNSIEARSSAGNVFQLSQSGAFTDQLTEVLRNGARALLAQAVEAEVAALPGCHADKLGPVAVRCPRVRDRVGEGSERIRFSSAILPPYARRSKSLEVLIPILYLKGVSTGDFDISTLLACASFNVISEGIILAFQNRAVPAQHPADGTGRCVQLWQEIASCHLITPD